MRYGLIGASVSHSFSKMIHERFHFMNYHLIDDDFEGLEKRLIKKDFIGINITMPYKKDVIKYLDEISFEASKIGVVNTVINKYQKLYGYNTDIYGFRKLLEVNDIELNGKTCFILGTGATASSIRYVLEEKNISKIINISRNKEDFKKYDYLYTNNDHKVIINTTPVGSFPRLEETSIDINKITNLDSYIDVVYNPTRTKSMITASKLGIKAVGGLDMLVYQAAKANELFFGKKIDEYKIKKVKSYVQSKANNIVLIGMPGSGKTLISKKMSMKLRKFRVDIDKIIEKKQRKTINEIFSDVGEEGFRNIESKVVRKAAFRKGVIIATGGGVILREENIDLLKANGIIIFINKGVDRIINDIHYNKRPLCKTKEDFTNLYNQRFDLYKKAADIIIDIKDENVNQIIDMIERNIYDYKFKKRNSNK